MIDNPGYISQMAASRNSGSAAADQEPSAMHVETGDAAACASLNMESGDVPDDVVKNDVSNSSGTLAACPAAVTEASETPAQPSLPPRGWRNWPGILLAHRRQTAAAVVLICMASIWIGEGSKTTPAPSTTSVDELQDVEALLSDFDMVDSQSLREPAEPLNSPGGGFQFTIPTSDVDHSAESQGSSQLPSATSVARYPDDSNPSELTAEGSLTIPNTSRPSNFGSTHDPGRPTGVRFTGQIQPLK